LRSTASSIYSWIKCYSCFVVGVPLEQSSGSSQLIHAVNPRPSDLLANTAVSNGEQGPSHKDVLGAVRSLITAWDDGHDKLWLEDEEKEKGFRQLRTEIESLRQKLLQRSDVKKGPRTMPATDESVSSSGTAAVRQSTGPITESENRNVKEAQDDMRKWEHARRQAQDEIRRMTGLRTQMQEEVRAIRCTRIQAQEEISALKSARLEAEEEIRMLKAARLETEKEKHKWTGMRLQVEEEMRKYKDEQEWIELDEE